MSDTKFQKIFGMLWSTHAGERHNAADRLFTYAALRKIHPSDVFSGRPPGTDAPALQAKLTQLRARFSQLSEENTTLRKELSRAQSRARELAGVHKQNQELTAKLEEARRAGRALAAKLDEAQQAHATLQGALVAAAATTRERQLEVERCYQAYASLRQELCVKQSDAQSASVLCGQPQHTLQIATAEHQQSALATAKQEHQRLLIELSRRKA